MVRPKSFDEIADLVSLGEAIDWDRVEREAADPAERALLRNLRVIGTVSRVAREDDPGSLVPDATMAEPVPAAKPAVKEGDTWGPLQLLEKVGSGSFGDVHRAWDPMLNRQVALKLLNARALERPGAREGVLEEARMLARVEHPHVARIYGVEEHDGRLGIWMEFVDGTDLESVRVERGKLPLDEALRLGAELCDAVHAVHAANVIHKDIKPQNTMLRRDGSLVLMDFGAGRGRQVREGDREVSVTGTPRYMAPETFRRDPATPQSDIYSIGVVLDHLVSGGFPVDGTVPEIMSAHEKGEWQPLRERAPMLPEAFVRIVEKATDIDRKKRHASAAELGDELRALRATLRPAPRRGMSRRRMLVTSLAVAAVATFAAIGIRSAMMPPPELEAIVNFSGSDNGQFVRFESGDAIDTNTELALSIELTRDAWVYVLNRDAEGNTVVLWPMDGDARKPLKGGRTVRIPGEIDGIDRSWRFSAVAGPERFLVVASVEQLPQFEQALRQVAALSIDGGLRITPIGDVQLAALGRDAIPSELTRGVVGLSETSDAGPDVFAIAEKFAEGGATDSAGRIYLHHVRLMNTGD